MSEELSGHLCAICGVDTDINGLRYSTLDSGYRSEYFCAKCVQRGETAVKHKVCGHCEKPIDEKVKITVMKKEAPALLPTTVIRGGATPDVWYGYGSGVHSEENIAYPRGHPNEGQPIPFYDKSSKAAAMKLAGVHEAGDRIRGARDESMVPKNRKTYI